MIDLQKQPDETLRQYIARVGAAKDCGEIDITWDALAPIMNEQTGENFSEGTYRQKWAEGKCWEKEVFSKRGPNEFLEEMRVEKENILKAKRQFFDQRREYNKLLTVDARTDHLKEQIVEVAREMAESNPFEFRDFYEPTKRERVGVLVLADFHYGMVAENLWQKYNTNICRERVQRVVEKTIEYIHFQGIRKLYVVLLGDLIHGAIHTSARVAAEEVTVDQLMHASELVSGAIEALSHHVEEVEVHSTYGNHARSIQNKNDSIHEDNMERIVPWWLRERLQNNPRVKVIDSDYHEFILIQPYGYNVVCTHGDLDRFKDFGTTVHTLFTKKFGLSIDYTITADKHHLEEFEQFGIESMLVRSLCGTDEYANGKRLYSLPGQSFIVFSKEDGRECPYNIRLD